MFAVEDSALPKHRKRYTCTCSFSHLVIILKLQSKIVSHKPEDFTDSHVVVLQLCTRTKTVTFSSAALRAVR